MALGEDKPIVMGIPGLVEVIPEVFRKQHRHQVGRRHSGGRVPRAGLCRGADGIDAQLLPKLTAEARTVAPRGHVGRAFLRRVHRYGLHEVTPSRPLLRLRLTRAAGAIPRAMHTDCRDQLLQVCGRRFRRADNTSGRGVDPGGAEDLVAVAPASEDLEVSVRLGEQ